MIRDEHLEEISHWLKKKLFKNVIKQKFLLTYFQIRHTHCFLILSLVLHIQSVLCGPTGVVYTYSGNTSDSPHDAGGGDARRLTYVKLGVAVGMFSITAAACALPLLVITCITRRMHSHSVGIAGASSNSPRSGDATFNYALRVRLSHWTSLRFYSLTLCGERLTSCRQVYQMRHLLPFPNKRKIILFPQYWWNALL